MGYLAPLLKVLFESMFDGGNKEDSKESPDPVCVPIPLHLINSSCSLAAAGFLNDSVQGLTWNP